MPNVEYCLDLRELIDLGALAQDQESAMSRFLEMPMLGGSRRLYLGSSFCPQALFYSCELMEAALEICRKRGMKATLSLPIATQNNLERLLEEAQAILDLGRGVIDEVVANDHGMLGWLCRKAASQKFASGEEPEPKAEQSLAFSVVIGRLLSKDARDPRDPEYPWQPFEPSLLQQNHSGESFLDRMLATWSFWDEESGEYWYPITGLELDPTHETLLLGSLPPQIMPAINGPLCYMSTGQICEYTSVGLADEELFRPNAPCAHQCTGNSIRYQGVSGKEFAKLGRTVYFQPSWQCVPQGIESYRQLISPLWEVHC